MLPLGETGQSVLCIISYMWIYNYLNKNFSYKEQASPGTLAEDWL